MRSVRRENPVLLLASGSKDGMLRKVSRRYARVAAKIYGADSE